MSMGGVQVDVIEAQSTELDKQIAHARNFKDAETAHEAFLTSLIEQSFLYMLPLTGILEAIYSLCLGLCSLVQVACLPHLPTCACSLLHTCAPRIPLSPLLLSSQDRGSSFLSRCHFTCTQFQCPSTAPFIQPLLLPPSSTATLAVPSVGVSFVADDIVHGLQRNQEAVQARESTAQLSEEAAAICSGFLMHTAQLYALLQDNTLQAPHRVPHLRQLLLRLNFNHFMEREAAEHAQVIGGRNEQKPDVLVVAE